MTRHLHLQGMGVVGSLVARQLELRGIDFTWSDTDAKHTAWRACTGITYRSGSKLDNDNFKWWTDHFPEYGQWMETAMFCHYSEKAPHGGRSKVVARVGAVRVSDFVSYHMNAQLLVQETQHSLRLRRTTRQSRNTQLVVTHGFAKIHEWSWGWMCPVQLKLNPFFHEWSNRPCFYLRDGFILDYLYPIPRQGDWWYAGTSLITQQEPRSLLIDPKLRSWGERVTKKALDAFSVQKLGSPVEGWRPKPHPVGLPVWEEDSTIYLRPQYGSGIRHFGTLWDALERKLGI